MDEAILSSALHILGRRDHSRHELFTKLRRKYPEQAAEIETILDYLEETGVCDDARFAREYVHYLQATNPKGQYRLRQELQKKGIAADLIAATLDEHDADETPLALQLARRKAASLPADLDIHKKRDRLYRFLVSRGFSFDTAREAAKRID